MINVFYPRMIKKGQNVRYAQVTYVTIATFFDFLNVTSVSAKEHIFLPKILGSLK